VLSKKPDIVFIYVGINDVWHKKSSGTGTDPDKFERFYNKIIDKLQAAGAKVIICTPTVIGEKKNFVNELDGDLNKYAAIIRNIAKNKNTGLIDLHKAIIEYIDAHNPEDKAKDVLTVDGVHMNDAGNEFLAKQFYPYIK
jgi:lysophospholipase L1-like esterase